MIHFSVLDEIGCAYVQEDDRVICGVTFSKSGLYVVRVIEVRFGSLESRSLASFFTSRLMPVEPECLREIEGTIKWYNPNKGYGFIIPDEGGGEIFMHSSVLYQVGYKTLHPGIRVLVKVFQSSRGLEARTLSIIEEKKREAL